MACCDAAFSVLAKVYQLTSVSVQQLLPALWQDYFIIQKYTS